MSTSWRRYLRALVSVAAVGALVAVTVGSAPALARPGKGRGKPVQAEPGWPENHFPENDPKPGEAGHVSGDLPVPEPAEGMTDTEFRAADPGGYQVITEGRAEIEAQALSKVRGALKAAGITPASEEPLDAGELERASAVLASTPYSPYGYASFALVPNYTDQWARNGYLGTVYFSYAYYHAAGDYYSWYTVSWPARSGDNLPYHQSWGGVGPAPGGTYDLGFVYGTWRGFEWDSRDSFYPGKWRLDPWTGAPYGRNYLEVHGGRNASDFDPTQGCIRMHSSSIASLRSYYTYKMANKYDPSCAHFVVRY